jgi:hypothetical protein
VPELAGGAVGVHCHPANRIQWELALSRLRFANRGEELDRLANVAQGRASARLVEDAFELGYERSGLRRH